MLLFVENALTLDIYSCCKTRDQNIISFSTHDQTVSFVFNTAVRGSRQVISYSHAGLFQLAFGCVRPGRANATSERPLSSVRFLCSSQLNTHADAR